MSKKHFPYGDGYAFERIVKTLEEILEMYREKNILFFADRLPPLIGGMEMHAKYFIEYFRDNQNYTLSGIVTKNQDASDNLILNDKNIKINIEELGKYTSPDIIFFNSGRWIEEFRKIRSVFPSARFFYRTGGNEILKSPLVEANFPSHKARQSYWVKIINENINILITNSLYTEKRLKCLGIKTPFKRFVGGVDISGFKNIKPRKNDLVTILCAARFVPYKNYSLMISVINELALRGLKFKVRLAGDGPLLTEIKKQVHKYNLDSVVEFLGVLENSQVFQEIFNADIYMQLSKDKVTKVEGGSYIHSEGMGRSILEALSAGTFVIAGKSGALPEIVHPPYGLLINLNDGAKAISKRITHIVKKPTAKMKIKNNFDWNKIFTGYDELFGNI